MKKSKSIILICNWKTYIKNTKNAKALVRGIKVPPKCNIVLGICPSFLHIKDVADAIGKRKILLGAQDISVKADGVLTGEVIPSLATNMGVQVCIVGHAEKRALGETNKQVGEKVRSALVGDLNPIICVGEREGEDRNKVLKEQVSSALARIKSSSIGSISFAYEPVWAIGKGVVPSNEKIHEAVIHIRKSVASVFGESVAFKFPILYGGSVNASNARDILDNSHVDGFLVGSASTDYKTLNKLIETIC